MVERVEGTTKKGAVRGRGQQGVVASVTGAFGQAFSQFSDLLEQIASQLQGPEVPEAKEAARAVKSDREKETTSSNQAAHQEGFTPFGMRTDIQHERRETSSNREESHQRKDRVEEKGSFDQKKNPSEKVKEDAESSASLSEEVSPTLLTKPTSENISPTSPKPESRQLSGFGKEDVSRGFDDQQQASTPGGESFQAEVSPQNKALEATPFVEGMESHIPLVKAEGHLNLSQGLTPQETTPLTQQEIALQAISRVVAAANGRAPIEGTQIQSLMNIDAKSAVGEIKQFQGNGAGTFTNQSGSSRSNENASTKKQAPLSRQLAEKTLERVEMALKEWERSKDGKTISLRLDPPQLGTVKVDISLREGNLHTRFVAESPDVNQLLREKGHEIQSMLRKLGLDVTQVTVSVGSDGTNFDQSSLFGQSTGGQGNTGNGNNSSQSGSEHSSFRSFLGEEGKNSGMAGTSQSEDHWVA